MVRPKTWRLTFSGSSQSSTTVSVSSRSQGSWRRAFRWCTPATPPRPTGWVQHQGDPCTGFPVSTMCLCCFQGGQEWHGRRYSEGILSPSGSNGEDREYSKDEAGQVCWGTREGLHQNHEGITFLNIIRYKLNVLNRSFFYLAAKNNTIHLFLLWKGVPFFKSKYGENAPKLCQNIDKECHFFCYWVKIIEKVCQSYKNRESVPIFCITDSNYWETCQNVVLPRQYWESVPMCESIRILIYINDTISIYLISK